MIYKFSQSQLLQCVGDFKTHCIEGGFVFVESKKKLFDFWEKASLPESYTKEQERLLSEAKAAKCAELNAVCDSHLLSFESSALGEIHSYDSALEDQMNLLGLVSAGIDSYFRCLKKGESLKENKPHTKAQLAAVYKDGLAHKSEQICKCGLLKARVMAAATLDEVASVAWEETKSE